MCQFWVVLVDDDSMDSMATVRCCQWMCWWVMVMDVFTFCKISDLNFLGHLWFLLCFKI